MWPDHTTTTDSAAGSALVGLPHHRSTQAGDSQRADERLDARTRPRRAAVRIGGDDDHPWGVRY